MWCERVQLNSGTLSDGKKLSVNIEQYKKKYYNAHFPDVSIEESSVAADDEADLWLEAAIAELQKLNLGVE